MNRFFLFCVAMYMMVTATIAQVSVWDGTSSPWTNGNGTQSNPYLIENAQQLAYLVDRVNNGFLGASTNPNRTAGVGMDWKLMTDIDLAGLAWMPVGYYNSGADYYSFGGNFDGNGHTIANLKVSGVQRAGLFGMVNGGSIKNLGIIGTSSVTGTVYAGGIVGYADNNNFEISDCYNTAIVSNNIAAGAAGGIIGCMTTGTPYTNKLMINDCYNTADIASFYCAGGIIGDCAGTAVMNNCYNTGKIGNVGSGNVENCGGIIGKLSGAGTISRCYNTGNVSAVYEAYSGGYSLYSYSGGLIGYGCVQGTLTITNSYNKGNISANTKNTCNNYYYSDAYSYSGGLLGYGCSATVNNSYNRGNVSATAITSMSYSTAIFYSGGIVGGNNPSMVTTISNCYNTGTATYAISGNSGTTTNCYYLNTCSSNPAGGISRTEVFMKSQDFVDELGYGFTMDNGNTNDGYPILSNVELNLAALAATNISATSAKLNGTLTFNNLNLISQGFEYKETSAANYTSVNVALNGDSLLYNLNGLNPNTSYTYRCFVNTQQTGTVYCNTKTFTTQAITVTTQQATNITATSATLNGTINVGGATTQQGFIVYNYTGTIVDSVSANVQGNNISYNISGLTPSTYYQYKAFVYVSPNNIIYGYQQYFYTTAVAITTQQATNITATAATLNASYNDSTAIRGFQYITGSYETHYESYPYSSIINDFSTSTTVYISGPNFTYNLTGLTPGAYYSYRSFVEIGGQPIYGNVYYGGSYYDYYNYFTAYYSFKTAEAVTTQAATNITKTTATLNGTIDFGSISVTQQGFILYKNAVLIDSIPVNMQANNISYNISNLTQNTNYQYKVFAVANSQTYYGNNQSFTTATFNQSGNAFLIETQNDLIALADLVNGGNCYSGQVFILANDIILPNTPNNIKSIGNKTTNNPFCGIFKGNSKSIYNVYIDYPNSPYQGLFGYTQNAEIDSLILQNITASGRDYTGGIIGYAENSRLTDLSVNGGTLNSLNYCGGLIGYQSSGANSVITSCSNINCKVTGTNNVGGLLGWSNQGTVRNSWVSAQVSGIGSCIGSVIGKADNVLFYYCPYNGTVSPEDSIGCYNFKSGENMSKGGITTQEMRSQAFVDKLNQGLTTPMWKMDYNPPINDGFPIHIWQTNVNPLTITTLSNIEVSKGTLTPAFNENIHNYTVNVGNEVTNINITATASVFGATVSGDGNKNINIGTNIFTIIVTAADSITKGNYVVKVVRGNIIPSGIDDYKTNSEITVFPNPTNGQITVQTGRTPSPQNIRIYDISGRMVQTQFIASQRNANANEFTIDISHLESGMYYLRIGNETVKIVKN